MAFSFGKKLADPVYLSYNTSETSRPIAPSRSTLPRSNDIFATTQRPAFPSSTNFPQMATAQPVTSTVQPPMSFQFNSSSNVFKPTFPAGTQMDLQAFRIIPKSSDYETTATMADSGPRLSTSKRPIGRCQILKESGITYRGGDIYGAEEDKEDFMKEYAADSKIPETVPPKSACF